MQVRDATGQPHASSRPRPGWQGVKERCKGLGSPHKIPSCQEREMRDAGFHHAADSVLVKARDQQPPPRHPDAPSSLSAPPRDGVGKPLGVRGAVMIYPLP